MSVELWLVRHGETPASRGRTLAGWADVPLTEHGETQAAALRPTSPYSWAGVAVMKYRLGQLDEEFRQAFSSYTWTR